MHFNFNNISYTTLLKTDKLKYTDTNIKLTTCNVKSLVLNRFP